MAIPLFKFPILVIQLILETMGFVEIFLLTNTSSRSKQIVKNLLTVRNYEIKLYLIEETLFVFNFIKQSNPSLNTQICLDARQNQLGTTFLLKIGNSEPVPSSIKNHDGEYFLKIYTDTHIHTGTQLYNVFIEVFKIPLQELAVRLNNVAVATYQSWIGWNNEMFYDISLLNFLGECGFSDYIWILNNARTRHRFLLQTEPTEYPETFETPNFGAEDVEIHHGQWIKLQHLKAIQAKEITILRVSLTDSEINVFLRDWKSTNEASNLKYLTLFFDREADLDVVLEGMEATDESFMKPDDVLNQWSFKLANGEKCRVQYSHYQRNTFGFEFLVEN